MLGNMLAKLEELDLFYVSKPVRKGKHSLVEFEKYASGNNGKTQDNKNDNFSTRHNSAS
jgi:hypothetical protein